MVRKEREGTIKGWGRGSVYALFLYVVLTRVMAKQLA